MQRHAVEQGKVISEQQLAEDNSARMLKRLQESLNGSDQVARQTIGELQQRCTLLQVWDHGGLVSLCTIAVPAVIRLTHRLVVIRHASAAWATVQKSGSLNPGREGRDC